MTCPKYIILLMIHITDENGRPYHLQNQYLPLLHNRTVCQRKNSPSWSMSMLWSRSFTFKRPPSLTWSDPSRFWFTNYQPGILKKENRKITKTFFFSLALFAITLLTFKNEIKNQVHSKRLKTLRSKFEFSFLAPTHFPQKLWGEADKISSIFILCDHVCNSHDHSILQTIDITRRNLMLITLRA